MKWLYMAANNGAETEEGKRVFNTGSKIVASSPQQFAATIKSHRAVTGKMIKDVAAYAPNKPHIGRPSPAVSLKDSGIAARLSCIAAQNPGAAP